jgi:serine/threonine protein kinase
VDLTVENMCGLLIRSRLLTPDGVRGMYSRWQADAKTAQGDIAQFGKWLVTNQFVTTYQAGLLARGQADCFFLNEYKILDRIGQGRMAGVYKAVHQLGQVVAIKVLPPSRAKDAQLYARFQREARLAMYLRHPNIVRAFQVGESNGLHYIVMEYLDGETLEDVLNRRNRLLPGEAVRLIYHLLQGLQHIHEQNLVHRDLKPSNLMLTPASPRGGQNDNTFRSTAKILDIGLGRALFDENAPAEPEDLQLTGEGVLLGTPDYLAPEQARDAHRADIRSDIYSVGCVLYHMLSGAPPFPDINIISQMVRHASEPPRPIRELNPAVPEGLQQVINCMLAKNPPQRYPNPNLASQALQPFLSPGAEVVQTLENDPQMRAYLKWLEERPKGGNKPALAPAPAPMAQLVRPAAPVAPPPAAPAPAVAAPRAVPVAVPAPGARPPAAPVVAAAPPADPVDALRKKKSKSKKKRKARLLAKLRRKKAAAAAAAAGVELVPVAAAPPALAGKRLGGLSTRDWILLGVGAGSVIIVGLLGMLMASKLSPEKTTEPPPAESSSP